MSEVNAKPDDMVRIFDHVRPPEFSGDVTRRAPDHVCGGLIDCHTALKPDQVATDKLHKLLTHMAQGISAYRQIVNDAAQTYADAADLSSKALTDQVKEQVSTAATYDPRTNLPDYAPGFDRTPT